MLSFQAGDVLAQLRALALQRCHFALRRRACAHTHSVLSNNSAYTYRLFPRMLTREPARGSSTSPLLRMLACALVNSVTRRAPVHLGRTDQPWVTPLPTPASRWRNPAVSEAGDTCRRQVLLLTCADLTGLAAMVLLRPSLACDRARVAALLVRAPGQAGPRSRPTFSGESVVWHRCAAMTRWGSVLPRGRAVQLTAIFAGRTPQRML
jgi:hypothetical protein